MDPFRGEGYSLGMSLQLVPTPEQIEGPFYPAPQWRQPGVERPNDLFAAPDAKPEGQSLFVQGTIRGTGGLPIKGAEVELAQRRARLGPLFLAPRAAGCTAFRATPL